MLASIACTERGLYHDRRTRMRIPKRVQVPLNALPQLNDTCAIDFTGDTLYSMRRDRIVNVIGDPHREALAIDTRL